MEDKAKYSQVILFNSEENSNTSVRRKVHESIVEILPLTPEELKNKGKNLFIKYSFGVSPFGNTLIASTQNGVCYLGFSDNTEIAFSELENRFPNANFIEQADAFQENALRIFSFDWNEIEKIKLHLKGTEFQLKVWKELLKIPTGKLTSYKELAENINEPKAARAVGTAIGSNPIAYIVPCHRVIQTSGGLGGYMWGKTRKEKIIHWERSGKI